jgi:hypothetical protein
MRGDYTTAKLCRSCQTLLKIPRLKSMSVVFGVVDRVGDCNDTVDDNDCGQRPKIGREAISHLLGESFDPRRKDVLLICRQVL